MSVKRMVICGTAGILMLVSVFVSCTVDGEPAGKTDQVDFTAGNDVVRHISDGDFVQEASGEEGTGVTFYTSSNEDVAMVNVVTGKVSVLSIGTAVITAMNSGDSIYNPVSDSYQLTVMEDRFITTWKTDNVQENSSNDHQICIPTDNSYSYNYTVDWGDGTVEAITSSLSPTHTYTTIGIYTIKIGGVFPRIRLGDEDAGGQECLKILSIDSWGTIRWQSMQSAFSGCGNLVYNATDAPDLSNVRDMSWMFADTDSFSGDLGGWDVSNVTNMGHMFYYADSFNGELNNWDVSNVTDMSYMFYGANKFIKDISGWDVSNVTYMNYMFAGARSFNEDLNSWNVSNVTDMSHMFSGAGNFNGDISGWDVSNVTDMSYMFYGADRFTGDIGDWDVSNVTDMSYMFSHAYAFNSDIGSWDVSNVINMDSMFKSEYDDTILFNGDISNWDVSSVKNMYEMFYSTRNFSYHDLSGWDVANVTDHLGFSEYWGYGNTEPIWP